MSAPRTFSLSNVEKRSESRQSGNGENDEVDGVRKRPRRYAPIATQQFEGVTPSKSGIELLCGAVEIPASRTCPPVAADLP
jgi:hypothetical protein